VKEGFDDETLCPSWKQYDLWEWWAAPFGTFSLNDNCIDVKIEPGTEGAPAKITIVPDTRYVTILNKTRTVKKSPKPWGFIRKPGTNEITFTGEIAGPDLRWVAIHDPYQFYGTVLLETLQKSGLTAPPTIVIEINQPGCFISID
jgi:D-alanyl-D-alanine carboxypeptidase/D-alanyl-D-alanine-endopeptidase (penicillin-binding protein 4)